MFCFPQDHDNLTLPAKYDRQFSWACLATLSAKLGNNLWNSLQGQIFNQLLICKLNSELLDSVNYTLRTLLHFFSHEKREVYHNLHAWPIEKGQWIWVLQPLPQLHKCQGSWSAFSRQRATIKLILMWLFPWQWHSHWEPYAQPGPCSLIPQWLVAHCHCLSHQRRKERAAAFPQTPQQIWLNFQLPTPHPPVCNTHLVSTAGDTVAASPAKDFPSATSFYTSFCEAAFGQNSLQMNKNKTVFIKEMLETTTSAVFGVLFNYVLARKHVLVKESTLQLRTRRQHNGTTQKTAGTVIPAK